ncbi:hypothetical protein I317_02747 [Kwoniella heveanensis CBS 569]|nr:hypothetical protein I317_02747 [Kwoniella heveanensis CBS 569]
MVEGQTGEDRGKAIIEDVYQRAVSLAKLRLLLVDPYRTSDRSLGRTPYSSNPFTLVILLQALFPTPFAPAPSAVDEDTVQRSYEGRSTTDSDKSIDKPAFPLTRTYWINWKLAPTKETVKRAM